jgi:hypothetical protein
MKFKVVHELDVPADKYWANLFNPDLERAASAKVTSEYRVLEEKEVNGVTERTVRTVPDVVLPGPIKKLFGNQIGYKQYDRIPKGGGTQYTFKVVPDMFSDKIEVDGNFVIEPLGENRCRRTISGEVTVKIFGVGGLFEKFVAAELDKNYATVAHEQEKWIKANT